MQVRFQDAIPKAVWERVGGPLATFVEEEWDFWAEEVSRKIEEEVEVERWLRNLQTPPHPPGS